MSILDLLFGSTDEEYEETTVVETSTGWTGTYPGPVTSELAEIFEEEGYVIVEDDDDDEEETQPWWKFW